LQLAWLNYAHDNQDRLVPNWTIFPSGRAHLDSTTVILVDMAT
jgi:hypothetical protein